MSGGAFTKLAEHQTWRGWLVSAGHATFASPAGERFERDIVHHPGAVAVVAVDAQRLVTLVRQFRAPVGEALLELPAGTRDVAGEEPAVTARRELAEEAGLEAGGLVELARCLNSPGFCDQQTVLFLATDLSPCAMARQGVEEQFMQVEQVPLDDLDRLVSSGEVVDQTTLLGLCLARAALPAVGPGRGE